MPYQEAVQQEAHHDVITADDGLFDAITLLQHRYADIFKPPCM